MSTRKARGLAIAGALVAAAIGLFAATRGGDERPRPPGDAGVAKARGRVAPAPVAASGRVAGTVRMGDAPVRGASVRLEIGGTVRVATADGFGQFELREVPVAGGTIEAGAPGYSGDSRRVELRTPAGARAAERLELLLSPCADELFGDVRDVGGAPLAGAEVRAQNRAALALGRALTDEEGRYHLCVASSQVGARAAAAGYGGQLRFVRAAGSTRVDFRLGPEAIIEGLVIDDLDERPVAGAEVRYPAGSVRTDEAGRFRITGLAPGRHRLDAIAGEGLGTYAPTEVEARVGVVAPAVVLRLRPGHLLAGRVVDGAGRPIPGERVSTANAPANVQLDTVSDEDGHFLLGPLPAGRTALALAGDDAGELREVVVPHDGELLLQRRASAWLRGRVLHEKRAVAGAVLFLEQRTSRSLADGSFEIGPVGAGAQRVSAAHREFGEGELAVTVADGEIKDGLVVELSTGATVSGVVVDQRGAPMPGLRVNLWADGGADHGVAATGADGSFAVTGLAGDLDYQVSVLGPSMMHKLAPAGAPFAAVHLDEGHREVKGLRLAVRIELGSLAGFVRRPSGQPVADASVKVTDGTMAGVVAATVTDEQGRFELADLIDSELDVIASTGDAVEARANDVPVGTRDLVLTLPATGTLRGDLVGFSRPPQVTVAAAGRVFRPKFFPTTTTDGFVVGDLPAGEYRVRAQSGPELDEATVTLVAGGEGHVTLRSLGAARLAITALEDGTSAPIPDALCGFGVASDPDGAVLYDRTDAQGRVELGAPAGQDLVVDCRPKNHDADQTLRIERRLAPGERASVTVLFARRRHLGLKLEFEGDAAVIREVAGPAAAAGVQPGDIISAIEGEPVLGASRDTFFSRLLSRPPGTVLHLSLIRGEASAEAAIVVGRMPDAVAFGYL